MDLRTEVLRAWHGTHLVSRFIPSDEARAQRVVDMLSAEYVKRTPLSASGTSEMPPTHLSQDEVEEINADITERHGSREAMWANLRASTPAASEMPPGPRVYTEDDVKRMWEDFYAKTPPMRPTFIDPKQWADALNDMSQARWCASRTESVADAVDLDEMPPASVVKAEQPQRARTEDAGSAGGALPPWPKQQAILGLVHQDNPDFALPCEECLPRTRRIIKVYELALRARDERIAELERDLVAAKREAMVWRHRFTKETEVLPEREKLQDSLENQYACITSLEAENARLRERAEKAEYSARQFCGAHIGVPQPDCPVCGKPNIAAARRDEQGEAASPSPAAGSARVWSEEQRDAARSVARVVEDAASKIVDDGLPHISSPCVTRTCAELARVAPLFAAPAPVAVTRERLIATVNDAYRAHHGRENDPHVGFVNGLDVRIADAVLSALSAPVSAEALERAVEAAWDARLSSIKPRFDGSERVRENWRKEVRAALASIGIATEGT